MFCFIVVDHLMFVAHSFGSFVFIIFLTSPTHRRVSARDRKKYKRFASSFASIRTLAQTVSYHERTIPLMEPILSHIFRKKKEKKIEEKTVSFYILGKVSVAREVYCTQRRKSALVRELRWISFTFNFVCIWFLFLCNAIALTLARICRAHTHHQPTSICMADILSGLVLYLMARDAHHTHTHKQARAHYSIRLWVAFLLVGSVCRFSMYAHPNDLCLCYGYMLHLYRLFHRDLQYMRKDDVSMTTLYRSLHRATHKKKKYKKYIYTIPFRHRLRRRLRSGVWCKPCVYPIYPIYVWCTSSLFVVLLFFLNFQYFAYSIWQSTMSHMFGSA